MSADVFLDTNILVYGVVHAMHAPPAQSSLLRQGGTVSVQVLNEFTNVALPETEAELAGDDRGTRSAAGPVPQSTRRSDMPPMRLPWRSRDGRVFRSTTR